MILKARLVATMAVKSKCKAHTVCTFNNEILCGIKISVPRNDFSSESNSQKGNLPQELCAGAVALLDKN
jgi:hypothetical protein